MLALIPHELMRRPLRMILTLAAVLAGVAVIAATLTVSNTIHRSIEAAFTGATRGADVIVTGRSPQNAPAGVQAPRVPARVLASVQALSDVQRAQGEIIDTAELVGARGAVTKLANGRVQALSFLGRPFQNLTLVAGRNPRAAHEVDVDELTAQTEHFNLGEKIKIATELPVQSFRIVGFVRLGGVERAGVGVLAFDLPEAQRLFLAPGAYDAIAVAGVPGVSSATLARLIAPLLGPELVVRSAAAVATNDGDSLAAQFALLTDVLEAISAIVALIGAFAIFNTLSATVASRTRELGLLRVLGASRAQIVALVLLQAAGIGLLAGAGGLVLALTITRATFNVLDRAGLGLPSVTPRMTAPIALIALGIGVLITLAAALVPALRAARVTPVAALREGVELERSSLGALLPWLALLLSVAGAAATVDGLAGGASSTVALIGVGALAVGVTSLSPRLIAATARIVGWPLERASAACGSLARGNAARNRARSAASATAVMLSLSLLLALAIFTTESRGAIRASVARSFAGDLAITDPGDAAGVPVTVASAVDAVNGVEVASVLKRSQATVQGGGTQTVNGIDTQTLANVYQFDWQDGDDSLLGFLGPNGALVEHNFAAQAGLNVGDHFIATTPAQKSTELTVRGIYRDDALLPGFAVDLPTFNEVFHQQRASRILVKLDPGVYAPAVRAAINRALAPYPQAQAVSQTQLQTQAVKRLVPLAYLFYALLAIAALFCAFTIVNCLALSVNERHRELGTLRSLGATRRTLRRMVRYEAAITTVIGACCGLALGVLFGAVITVALAGQGFTFAIPWLIFAALFGGVVLLGVLAAAVPAVRAGRVNVLEAIAFE